MKEHKRKMTAPIIVCGILILYYAVYLGLLLSILPGVWKYLLGLVPLALIPATVAVCIERINEIKKGEEDDISKY